MAGAKVARGAAFGQTNAEGTEVTDGQVDHGQLFTHLPASGRSRLQPIVGSGWKRSAYR